MRLETLKRQPFETATHLVYADVRQGSGDPRGSLIAVQHALGSRPRFYELTRLQDTHD